MLRCLPGIHVFQIQETLFVTVNISCFPLVESAHSFCTLLYFCAIVFCRTWTWSGRIAREKTRCIVNMYVNIYIYIYMIYNYTYIAMSCYRIYIMMTHTSFIILWKQFAVLQKSQQVGDYQRMKDIMPDTNAWLHAWIRSAPGCML